MLEHVENPVEFMKEKLSDDAYILLQTQTNPPPYIMNYQKSNTSRITVKMILDFFELEDNNKNKINKNLRILK